MQHAQKGNNMQLWVAEGCMFTYYVSRGRLVVLSVDDLHAFALIAVRRADCRAVCQYRRVAA